MLQESLEHTLGSRVRAPAPRRFPVLSLTPTRCLAVEDSDSGGAGLEDALEQTSERHGSGGMPAVELLREGRELFVQARRALQPLTLGFCLLSLYYWGRAAA